MMKYFILALAALSLVGCTKSGVSSEEQSQQTEAFGQDAYEEAMIKAGREDELKAEKEKWAKSQGQPGNPDDQQDEGQEQGSSNPGP